MHHSRLSVWKKGIELAKRIHTVTEKFPRKEQYGLTDQIRKASVSIPSNIAEGSQRTTNKDFAHFISMAKGSAAELETQLILAHDFGYIFDEEVISLLELVTEISKMLYSFHASLETRDS